MDTTAIAKLLEITYKSANNNERQNGEDSLFNAARSNIALYHHLLEIVASPDFPSDRKIYTIYQKRGIHIRLFLK